MKPVDVNGVQSLVLRRPSGPAVAHLILTVPGNDELQRKAAMDMLRSVNPDFGPQSRPCASIGFSFAGLEALGVPEGYLRLIRRLAAAFADGAVLRSLRIGDSGLSAPPYWNAGFQRLRAHVLLSWHGEPRAVCWKAKRFAAKWRSSFRHESHGKESPELIACLQGKYLGAPPGQEGQWVHFGYRDGISEIWIDEASPVPDAPDLRRRAPGDLLLGEINSADANPFALSQAPEKVRTFFRSSSFGILRPMEQDINLFQKQVQAWADQLSAAYNNAPVSAEFVKAKLCGRWPDGRQMRPDDFNKPSGTLKLNLEDDPEGFGCPFGSHVRRLRAVPDGDGRIFDRPLQRRSIPFGPAAWGGVSEGDSKKRGLLGHFFCADIENQFEHLIGQWAARAPLGFAPDNNAPDPLMRTQADANAGLVVPWKDRLPQRLSGISSWTRTLGTMYAWYPAREGLCALLNREFERDVDRAPWL